MPATSSGARDRPGLSRALQRRNNGIIRNLPADAITESPGFIDRFGLNMVEGIDR
jgi:alpha-galactosidase/6-phospho-beta-glucosidase family protein